MSNKAYSDEYRDKAFYAVVRIVLWSALFIAICILPIIVIFKTCSGAFSRDADERVVTWIIIIPMLIVMAIAFKLIMPKIGRCAGELKAAKVERKLMSNLRQRRR